MTPEEMTADDLYLALAGARARLLRAGLSGGPLTEADHLVLERLVQAVDHLAQRRIPERWTMAGLQADAESCALEYGVRYHDSEDTVTHVQHGFTEARHQQASGGTVVERQVWRGPWREVPDEAR